MNDKECKIQEEKIAKYKSIKNRICWLEDKKHDSMIQIAEKINIEIKELRKELEEI